METYLERRLNSLLINFEKGKILFAQDFLIEDEKNKLIKEIELLKRLPNGCIDIASATRNVRAFARMIYDFDQYVHREPKADLPFDNTINLDKVIETQRNYFTLLEEFFIASTGKHQNDFLKDGEDFASGIHRIKGKKSIEKMFNAYNEYIPKIQQFHLENINVMTKSHKVIGGLKCVYGGSSRVNQSTFDSYKKIALYSDTVFIPDPVLPWLEVERQEERYNLIHILQASYYLLRFKSLVDADLPYPALIVFPSWEKTLEKTDEITQDGISSLIIRFFSHYLEETFEDEREIFSYVMGEGKEKFQSYVVKKNFLFPQVPHSHIRLRTHTMNILNF